MKDNMTDVRVAINGFGRIGRLAFRQMFVAEGYEVVAINDLTTPHMLAYLLKHDTTHGKWDHEISADDEKGTIRHRCSSRMHRLLHKQS